MSRKIPDSDTLPVNVNAWLDELAALGRKNDEGNTCAELAEAAGVSIALMRRRLQRAHALGRLVCGKRTANYIDGRQAAVPVYRVLPAPRKPSRK
jgi:hypothetical protein